jgi:hypothetical protein
MPTICFSVVTEVAAERFLAALTDFTASRPRWWPNLDPRFYQVHSLGETFADVTEGSSFAGGIWERGVYDWSTPGVVRFDVRESNAFAPGSSWDYRVAAQGGRTQIDVTVRRRPRTLKARMIGIPLRVFGRRVFRNDLERTLTILQDSTRARSDR